MKSPQRVAMITRFSAGKTVLDLGCANFDGVAKRSRRGTWLHEQIHRSAKRVVGIDVDAEAVSQMREWGYDTLVGDVEHLEDVPDPGPIDVVVAGDIIEHVSSPGLLLEGAHRFFGPDTIMVITTCNAFYWRNFIYTWQKRERVHDEHTCWYSHDTLRAVLDRHDYDVEEDMFSLLKPSDFKVKSLKSLIRRLLYGRTLRFSKSLIFVVSSRRAKRAAGAS